MRIALCLSGQPRNVRAGWDNLNSTIIQENSNLDIFVHTWWDESYVGTTFENAYACALCMHISRVSYAMEMNFVCIFTRYSMLRR